MDSGQLYEIAIEVLGFIALVLLGKSFLPKYFEEKAKNLATREDVAGITREIEKVKLEFSVENEQRRAQIGLVFGESQRLRARAIETLLAYADICIKLRFDKFSFGHALCVQCDP